MATVVLSTIGSAVGGAIGGPFGAVIGRAAGALAGSAIDQKLFGGGEDVRIEGPRLEGTRFLTSSEGAPIPKVYGRGRLSGEIIWATRFEEKATTETVETGGGGGKGSSGGGGSTTTRTTYSYYANFAVAICEGQIAVLNRVWADGEELDLTKIDYQLHRGSRSQDPDPLIEAKQGLANTPGYRGTAYIVFEGLPLEKWGNRIPQLSFEVIRPVGKLEKQIETITVIPGATEYGYDTRNITTGGGQVEFRSENRHITYAGTDWSASMTELLRLCPNLKRVALVVAWFGTDLRAGNCRCLPGVTQKLGGADWQVSGTDRINAYEVTRTSGRPAYGGTPDDESLVRTIQYLKDRGLKVTLYPFLMMDIPSGNALPNPKGGTGQPRYPWRGEITCHPAPGELGTVDKTGSARTQVRNFVGNATAGQFSWNGRTVRYSGNEAYSYRHLILHYARLCQAAGGVDGFLIGSELRGLTRVRDGGNKFPFVEELIQLASDAKSILGQGTEVTYGADWTEYFGYQPQDGTGDVYFNLDPLWASNNIDAIGIDNYMPLGDWREDGDPVDEDVRSPADRDYIAAQMAGGEGFDWYYRSNSDRTNGVRTPITDGQGEPWVFRYKDLVSWWSNEHRDRPGGVRRSNPTAWQPFSKPIHMTEIGCPAVNKGTNQPNVFFDPKSDQSALPYFSNGGRDDLIQRRALEVTFDHWRENANNPSSPAYSGRMVDVSRLAPWAWDARPFPRFPMDLDVWSDGDNWHKGHWLNGRLGGCPLNDLIAWILDEYGIKDAIIETDGIVDGYILPQQTSARRALEPLLSAFDIDVFERDGKLHFVQRAYADEGSIPFSDMVQEDEEPLRKRMRASETELPAEVLVTHASVFGEYESTITKSRRLSGDSDRQVSVQLPTVIPEQTALELAENRLRMDWGTREELEITLAPNRLDLSVGDVVEVAGEQDKWRIASLELSDRQRALLRPVPELSSTGTQDDFRPYRTSSPVVFGKPETQLMDLPLLRDPDINRDLVHASVFAKPWAGIYRLTSSVSLSGFETRDDADLRARMGELVAPLGPFGSPERDFRNAVELTLFSGNLASVDTLSLLNGSNAAAVKSSSGEWEILQFESAQLLESGNWRLTGLLRGQLGTENEALAGAFAGAPFVLLDQAVQPVELRNSDVGIPMNWRIGPARDAISADSYQQLAYTHGGRSRQMLSPVHLAVRQSAQGEMVYSWTRRGRMDADSWDNQEIPLDARAERYRVRLFDNAENPVQEVIVSEPYFQYPSAQRNEDFGVGNTPAFFDVAQLNDAELPGISARLELWNTII